MESSPCLPRPTRELKDKNPIRYRRKAPSAWGTTIRGRSISRPLSKAWIPMSVPPSSTAARTSPTPAWWDPFLHHRRIRPGHRSGRLGLPGHAEHRAVRHGRPGTNAGLQKAGPGESSAGCHTARRAGWTGSAATAYPAGDSGQSAQPADDHSTDILATGHVGPRHAAAAGSGIKFRRRVNRRAEDHQTRAANRRAVSAAGEVKFVRGA